MAPSSANADPGKRPTGNIPNLLSLLRHRLGRIAKAHCEMVPTDVFSPVCHPLSSTCGAWNAIGNQADIFDLNWVLPNDILPEVRVVLYNSALGKTREPLHSK